MISAVTADMLILRPVATLLRQWDRRMRRSSAAARPAE
jgi:hypothetical protein